MIILVNGATRVMQTLLPHRHLGVLYSPGTGNRQVVRPGTKWAIDNGAFSGFDEAAWLTLIDRLIPDLDCLFCVAPDVVGDPVQTRLLFERYKHQITTRGFPLAYVLQDGQKWEQVPWEECAAIFVGGTTAFKESREAVALMHEATRRGKWLHMGRLNSMRRLRFAASAGCDSFDGSSFSWYSATYLPNFLEKTKWISRDQGNLALD